MINRVLIRIKVVQMLYCYLLTCNDFKVEAAPRNDASKDRKFAYHFYLGLLRIMMRVSGGKFGQDRNIPGVGDNKYLASNKMIKALQSDSDLRKLMADFTFEADSFEDAIISIYDAIVKSSVYRSYIRRKNTDIATDVNFWLSLIPTVLEKNSSLMSAARKLPDFTLAGYERAFIMLTETLQGTGESKTGYVNAIKSLQTSLDKAYELYKSLLLLPVEITRLQDNRIDNARNKFLPSMDDLNPNTKFIDNKLIELLSGNDILESFRSKNDNLWITDPTLLRKLLDKILDSEIYRDYMKSTGSSLKEDCDLWRSLFRNIILPSDELAEALEFESVYWNDDIDIVGTFVLKSFKKISSEDQGTRMEAILPKFKDDIDARFGAELFEDTVTNFDLYREYIDRFVDPKQWDADRLAFMDVVIMATAISELLNFPEIPIPVTLNEYIEIANCYSTPRSGQFINGILYSVINELKREGKLVKN